MADTEEVDPEPTWDFVADQHNPQPLFWPECSYVDKNGSECKTAFVWKRAFSFSQGYVWCWMKDCKHKKGGFRIMTKDGEYKPDGDGNGDG